MLAFQGCVSPLIFGVAVSSGWMLDVINSNTKRCGRKEACLHLMYYPGISLEELKKITKKFAVMITLLSCQIL
jgi:hypothetical protein